MEKDGEKFGVLILYLSLAVDSPCLCGESLPWLIHPQRHRERTETLRTTAIQDSTE